jgi:hypothetical protein
MKSKSRYKEKSYLLNNESYYKNIYNYIFNSINISYVLMRQS